MSIHDARALQLRASDPAPHVWVSASAGSGKTTVLVSRILRLLLSGVQPRRILCLTYTKAAAMEMRIRLSRILSEWASVQAGQLAEKIEERTGEAPTQAMVERARGLFAMIADAPDELRIQTIHSFCQSILARFPIEAGLPPGFNALDEYQSAPLLRRALENAWRTDSGAAWQSAKAWAERRFSMTQLEDLLPGLMREYPEISAVMDIFGEETYWQQSFAALQMPENEHDIWHGAFDDAALPLAALRAWLAAKYSDALDAFLIAAPDARISMRDDYINLFLKEDLEKRKAPLTKAIIKEIGDDAANILMREQERVYELSERAKNQRLASASAAMGIVLARVHRAYQEIKEQRGALDFNDLIQKTHQLLSSPAMGPWVHYKLEGGIDHVLVDEAQDTAPLQWQVIIHLIEEFFTGAGRSERVRRLFVVGDPKQSIYSFQGADARAFQNLHGFFAQRAAEVNARWEDVPMQYSFRTSQNLLRLVDEVFVDVELRRALQNTDEAIAHQTVHTDRTGQVKIYPPVPAPPRQMAKGLIAGEDDSSARHNALLAQQIAATVKSWLDNGKIISGTQKTVQPKDILILLQQRTSLAGNILAALRNANIPVLGSDRLKLLEAAAVQDMISFCRFLLLPGDDMNLAQLLRSPLIDLQEEKLLAIAAPKNKFPLWQKLLQSDETEIIAYLKSWLGRADTDNAYKMLVEMLALPCPAADSGWRAFHRRLGEEGDDPINELLQLALREGQPDQPLGMEDFIHWVLRADVEVKREMAQHEENAVRILTVHGAKGLEAPIVIMADATETPHNSKKSRSTKFTEALPHFLFAPDKTAEGSAFDRTENQDIRASEYQRLLYVAMTRAEHELHIFGKASSKGEVKENNWYSQITAAAKTLGAAEISEDMLHYGASDQFGVAAGAPSKSDAAAHEWLQSPLPQRDKSRPVAVTEYLQQKYPRTMQEYSPVHLATERGVIMHKLLELLPQVAPDQQPQAAARYIANQLRAFPQMDVAAWPDEVMNILRAPEFAPFFERGAQAEATVSGHWGGAALIGVIDRFYVTDDEIHILDFKTAANPPPAGEIPPQYVEQLQIYAHFLTELFPNRRVCAGILWTANLRADWLDAEKLRLAA